MRDQILSNPLDRWICDYGKSHTMSEGIYKDRAGDQDWGGSKCGCRETYGVPYIIFIRWCQSNFKINHSHEITDYIRDEYLKVNPVK